MSVLIFIAVIVALIVVHELGHFHRRRNFQECVSTSSASAIRRAHSQSAKVGETEYTLNWLPFGGL